MPVEPETERGRETKIKERKREKREGEKEIYSTSNNA